MGPAQVVPIAGPGRQLTLDQATSLYAGEDGVLDPLEAMMLKYDRDRSGNFSCAEVKAIVNDLKSQQERAQYLKKIILGGFAVFIVFCGVMIALVMAANEASKESHVEPTSTSISVMTSVDGGTVSTAEVKSYNDIRALEYMDPSALAKVDDVSFKTGDCCADPATWDTVFMRVMKWKRDESSLELYGPHLGDTVVMLKKDLDEAPRYTYKSYPPGPENTRAVTHEICFTNGRRRLSHQDAFRRLSEAEQSEGSVGSNDVVVELTDQEYTEAGLPCAFSCEKDYETNCVKHMCCGCAYCQEDYSGTCHARDGSGSNGDDGRDHGCG